jgi:thioredoxin reductase (NADPH)
MDTLDPSADPVAIPASRPDRVFPTLTQAQIARIVPHGRHRAIASGDVLVEVGQRPVPFFVVLTGEMQVLRPSLGGETLIVTHRARQFTGEGTMLTGRRALERTRVSESGEVIELDRQQLLALIQNDAELSEIFMRAFILRRTELIAGGYGDVVLIGSTHCAGTLRVEEFLTRNGHPFHYIDLDRDSDAQDLLDRFHVTAADVPVMICRGDAVLRNPSNQQIADCLGFNDSIDRSHVRDLVMWAPGRPDSLPPSTPRPKDWMCSCSSRTCLEVRPVRARESKTTGFSRRHFRPGAHRAAYA